MAQPRSRSLVIIAIAVLLGGLLALGGSQGSWSALGLPGFAWAVIVAFAVQWIAFIPAAAAQTDRFFDATGSATYIAVTAVLLILAPAPDLRTVILAIVIMVWAARLGSFLLVRNLRSGGDGRFEEIRVNPVRFLSVWTMQGLWVSLTAAAGWIVLASEQRAPADAFLWLGLALWLLGFGIETIADAQKSRFRADPANRGRFIASGLWGWSRHPNYFGEIVLWIGVLAMTLPVLSGWQWIALLSPIFVIFLLARVSGIPLLEKRAEERWGDEPAYREYKERTSVLLPLPPRR